MATAAVQKQGSSPRGVIPRPQLRNLLATSLKKHALLCFAFSIGSALAFRQLVAEPRKQKYAEFWRNYDSHADYKRMVKAGVFPDITVEDVEEMEKQQLAELKKRFGK